MPIIDVFRPGSRTRRWLRRLGIGMASSLVLFTIVGFLVAPRLSTGSGRVEFKLKN